MSRAVVGGMKGHAGAWMFFGLVGTRFEALGEDLPSPTLRLESHTKYLAPKSLTLKVVIPLWTSLSTRRSLLLSLG